MYAMTYHAMADRALGPGMKEAILRQRVAEAEQALAWARKDLEDYLTLRQEIACAPSGETTMQEAPSA